LNREIRLAEPNLIPLGREEARRGRPTPDVTRRHALDRPSTTDKEIVAVLSEHRLATTQICTLLESSTSGPPATGSIVSWKLGLCGGHQATWARPLTHWWPSRLADAFHRGVEPQRVGNGKNQRYKIPALVRTGGQWRFP
jgi:hypothetical protein